MACVLQGSVCSRMVVLLSIDKDDENGTPGFGSIGDGNGSSVRDEAVCVDHKLRNCCGKFILFFSTCG